MDPGALPAAAVIAIGLGNCTSAADAIGLTETATTCSVLKSNALTRILIVAVFLKFLIDQKESICLIVEI
jgi:hypothetical protein